MGDGLSLEPRQVETEFYTRALDCPLRVRLVAMPASVPRKLIVACLWAFVALEALAFAAASLVTMWQTE